MSRWGLQTVLIMTTLAMFGVMFYAMIYPEHGSGPAQAGTIALFLVLLIMDYGDKRRG